MVSDVNKTALFMRHMRFLPLSRPAGSGISAIIRTLREWSRAFERTSTPSAKLHTTRASSHARCDFPRVRVTTSFRWLRTGHCGKSGKVRKFFGSSVGGWRALLSCGNCTHPIHPVGKAPGSRPSRATRWGEYAGNIEAMRVLPS